jgi:hydrogenase maturation protein HypF
LTGWVRNTSAGVEIELQGTNLVLNDFEAALQRDLPPLAVVTSSDCREIALSSDTSLTILSSGEGVADIQIAPDSAVCADCLRELLDPADRRYRYPFITCTNCGPRYTIITGIPYDRPKTTMVNFPLCPDCHREYKNPLDRRFHAQPIACHKCGPQVSLLTPEQYIISENDDAITQAVDLLKNGNIIAIKGIGGYHLAVDACNFDAVKRLRERKKRDEKPFALMVANIEEARKLAEMSDMEERLICSPEAPIVIVRKRAVNELSPLVAPNNGWLGLMLPYAPLHHLLMLGNFTSLVMTSGNISDEPVAFEDDEAMLRLAHIADYFLLHNRPIHIRIDDSVMRVFQGKSLFYRRARGFAPRAVTLPFAVPPLLAAGAELKGAACLAEGNKAFLSQHIGDLQNSSTLDSFNHTVRLLSEILKIKPESIACDLHPDYLSTRFAEDSRLPLMRVQHHHAHMASCMAENVLDGDVIGIIFDGTGYGADGTIWGGEFLIGGYSDYQRAGHFRPVPLPGGDAAVREPWRMAMSYLYQALGEAAFAVDNPVATYLSADAMLLFAQLLRRGINSPLTSSCGRLFDAVAAMLNMKHIVSYDGQAAIELEALAEEFDGDERSYTCIISTSAESPIQLDFSRMFVEIASDINAGIEKATISYSFHRTVASAATDACTSIASSTGLDRVVLSGGVFQNRLLSEMIYTAITDAGLKVYTHRLVPPNDGGIALGQVAIAGRRNN